MLENSEFILQPDDTMQLPQQWQDELDTCAEYTRSSKYSDALLSMLMNPVTETEKSNLLHLHDILQADLPDEEFREQLRGLFQLLPSEMQDMKGLQQTSPDRGIDSLDHTYNATHTLSTVGLQPEDRYVARAAMLFHDVGKVLDAANKDRPRFSAVIVQKYLDAVPVSKEIKTRITHHIRHHDALGEIARYDGRNAIQPDDVLDFFPTLNELQLHKALVQADVSSTPELVEHLPNINAVYAFFESKLKVGEELLHVQRSEENTLPFEPVDVFKAGKIAGSLHEGASFDSLENVFDHMLTRREKYESELSPEDKEYLEHALVQACLQPFEDDSSYASPMMGILREIGREMDRSYVVFLEEKYGVKLDALRVVIEIFLYSYKIWHINYRVRHAKLSREQQLSESDLDEIFLDLNEVQKSTQLLKMFSVDVTHGTSSEGADAISSREVILKSDTTVKDQYEGDGVYVGLFDSFIGWGLDENTFVISIPLEETVPMLASYNHPRVEVIILGDGIDIRGGRQAVAHGFHDWRKNDYRQYRIEQWQVDMISTLLDCKVTQIVDHDELATLVIDTDAPPIEWGALCRALCIPHALVQQEFSKLKLVQMQSQFQRHNEIDTEPTPLETIAEEAEAFFNTSDTQPRRLKFRGAILASLEGGS